MVFSLLAFVCFMIISTCIRCFQHNRVRVGVDFGPKLIGVAQVNYLGKVRSVKVITNPGNFSTISREIVGIAERLSACEIILGVNLDRSGLLGYDNVTNKNGRTCLDFSKVLCCWANRLTSGKVKVKLYDERFSTKEAQFKTNAISSKGNPILSVDTYLLISFLFYDRIGFYRCCVYFGALFRRRRRECDKCNSLSFSTTICIGNNASKCTTKLYALSGRMLKLIIQLYIIFHYFIKGMIQLLGMVLENSSTFSQQIII